MAAPVNNPDDNVAINSARVVRILLDSETFLVEPSRPNMAHPFPFDSLISCSTPYRNDGSEATGAHRRLLVKSAVVLESTERTHGAHGLLLVQNDFSPESDERTFGA